MRGLHFIRLFISHFLIFKTLLVTCKNILDFYFSTHGCVKQMTSELRFSSELTPGRELNPRFKGRINWDSVSFRNHRSCVSTCRDTRTCGTIQERISREGDFNGDRFTKFLLLLFLVTLVYALSLHQNDSAKCVKLGEPQFSGRATRKVAEMVTKIRGVPSKRRSHKEENESNKGDIAIRATSQADPRSYPFGCSKEDLSEELNMYEINRLIDSCSFFVSRKKAYIIFYHYNNYLKRTFHDMVSELSHRFEDLSSKHGISERDWKKYWALCEQSITHELTHVDYTCTNGFYFFVKKRVFYLDLREFLIRCKDFWHATIHKTRERCLHLLTQAEKDCEPVWVKHDSAVFQAGNPTLKSTLKRTVSPAVSATIMPKNITEGATKKENKK
ncbi:hypothetical protein C922_02523 [Plasmodium inui San Antonio 1]|uniref:Plasmodium RESA N-terminal domain-containing protein n=1 Tax=Plasmodium inui San Antonio 1 TaxID=1237626 RepID=W7ACT6_9APIC|nr:hypothetical protein C922_02523 [Plasmodium inui San Antonio 1]EUD66939.1 hypothetical protein C922_02523 [Plasmodium inui San Antonio 1]